MNLRPSGYEPDELPDCSTPRHEYSQGPGPNGIAVKGTGPFATRELIVNGSRAGARGSDEDRPRGPFAGFEDLAATYSPTP